MTRTVLIALFIITITVTAHARLGETPEQCEQRYGKHIKEVPGHGLVEFCRTYKMQGLNVHAVFVRGRTAPKVGCILYTTHRGEGWASGYRKLTKEELDGLLATVPGTWKFPRKTPAPKLQGGGPVKRLTVKPNSIDSSHKKAARAAVAASVNTVYPGIPAVRTQAVAANGHDKYSFTISGGMAITFYKVSESIVAWSKAVEAQRAEARKPDPKELKGF